MMGNTIKNGSTTWTLLLTGLALIAGGIILALAGPDTLHGIAVTMIVGGLGELGIMGAGQYAQATKLVSEALADERVYIDNEDQPDEPTENPVKVTVNERPSFHPPGFD